MKRAIAFCLMAASFAAAAGCSSDTDTPLGAEFLEDSLIGSRPGAVFEDTVVISSGDTSFVVNSLITGAKTMRIGRIADRETSMLIRFNFTPQGDDTTKTVDSAQVRILMSQDPGGSVELNARFFELAAKFTEKDTITSLQLTGGAIPAAQSPAVDRTLKLATSRYSVPGSLAQGWIRAKAHNGIAVVLEDTTTTKEFFYNTRESNDKPFLVVFFSDLSQRNYPVSNDGTFSRELSPPPDLKLSDGVVRRIYLPVDLSGLGGGVLLHGAQLVLSIVPNSLTSGDPAVRLYAPTSSTFGEKGLLSGTLVASDFLDGNSATLRLPIRTIVRTFIADPARNHGLVLRYTAEGSAARGVRFYDGAAADSLRPRIIFTFSEPPVFP